MPEPSDEQLDEARAAGFEPDGLHRLHTAIKADVENGLYDGPSTSWNVFHLMPVTKQSTGPRPKSSTCPRAPRSC